MKVRTTISLLFYLKSHSLGRRRRRWRHIMIRIHDPYIVKQQMTFFLCMKTKTPIFISFLFKPLYHFRYIFFFLFSVSFLPKKLHNHLIVFFFFLSLSFLNQIYHQCRIHNDSKSLIKHP